MARILVVDDSPELLEFFSLLLKMKGYVVKTAASKNELESQLKLFSPHLVLLDVMLNGDDGRELCKEIKSSYKNILVIILSANPETLKDYEECGADDFIEKPFDISTIVRMIDKILNKDATTIKN